MSAFLRCEDLYKTYILRRRRAWLDGDDDEEDADDEVERGDEDRERRPLEQPEDGKPKREQPVLRGVTFEAHAGEVIGVVGVAGCGKSTLLDILARKTLPTSGKVEGNGLVIGFRDFQRPIIPIFSARQNLRFIAALHGFGKTAVAPLIEEAAATVGATGYLDVRASRVPQPVFADLGTLFGLLLRPDILLLDDVRTLVSTRIRSAFPERFAEYLAETPCLTLIATNKLSAVERYANKAIWLHEGRVRMEGEVETVLASFSQFTDETPVQLEPGPEMVGALARETAMADDALHDTTPAEHQFQTEASGDMASLGVPPEEQQEQQATLADVLSSLGALTADQRRPVPHGHTLERSEMPALALEEDDGDLARLIAILREEGETGRGISVDKPLEDCGRVLAVYVNTARARGVTSVAPGEDVEIEVLLQLYAADVIIDGRAMLSVSVFEEEHGRFSNYAKLAKTINRLPIVSHDPGCYALRIDIPGFLMRQSTRLTFYKVNLTIDARTPDGGAASQNDAKAARALCSVRWAARGDLNHEMPNAKADDIKKPYALLLRPDLPWRLDVARGVPLTLWQDLEAEAVTADETAAH